MKRGVSSAGEARRRLDRLRALRGSGDPLREHVLSILEDEANPEIILRALEVFGDIVRPMDRLALREVYDYFDENGPKRDPTGPIRVEVLRVLWHLRSSEDLLFAKHAARTFEPGLNGNGEMIRAGGLALLGAIDPIAGCLEASRVLGTRDASEFSGEPSATAIRLLASHGENAALLMYALDPPPIPGELAAEAIRSLAGVPIEYLSDLLIEAGRTENEAIMVGLADLVGQLPPSEEVLAVTAELLGNAPRPEIYDFLVSSIVASRRQDLIGVFVASLPAEMSQKRLKIALDALRLAPRLPEVESAVSQVEARLAKQAPPPR